MKKVSTRKTQTLKAYNPEAAADAASAKLDREVDDALAGKRTLKNDSAIKTKTRIDIGDNLYYLLALIIITFGLCYCHKVDADKKPDAPNTTDSAQIEVK
jgi:hypothetical protein